MENKGKAQLWLFLTIFAGLIFNFVMPPIFLNVTYRFSGGYIFTSFIVYLILVILFAPAPFLIFSPCSAVEKTLNRENSEKCFVETHRNIVYIDIYIVVLFTLAGYIIALDLFKRGLWTRLDFVSFIIWSFATGLGVGLLASSGFRLIMLDYYKALKVFQKPKYIKRSVKLVILYMTIMSVFISIVYMTLASYRQIHAKMEVEKKAVIQKMEKIRKLPVEDAITEIGFLQDDIEELFSQNWKMGYLYTLPLILLIVVALNPIVFAIELRRSLYNLLESTEKAANGDLRSFIPVTRVDEVGELTSMFNLMIESLGRMVKNILHLGSQIDALSNNIKKSITDNSTSIAEISASVQQISASIEEFKRSVEDIHSQIQDLNQKMEKAGDTVEANKALLEGLFKDIDLLTAGIQNISDKVQNLSQKISMIGEVGNVIYKIADDTHLLSINASIEASVAGEYGKRFSIIASEIRKLAEDAKNFASQIESIIKEITQAASEAITTTEKSVSDAGKSLAKIGEARKTLDLLFSSVIEGRKSISIIERSTGQQETSIKQLAEALKEVKKAIEMIRQSSHDLENSFNNFSNQIEILNQEIKRFKINEEK